jgi:glycosyltransferase involved in cell wall biosynthesis
MDYAPNIAAARRVIDRILPFIRQDLPEATFHVVGRNPTAELLDHDGAGGCHVWGRVNDIRPWLKAADMAIVPLDIARGVQNKVLEAMAMALPVVLTSGAATGIDALDGVHFTVADSDAALAAAALALLRDHRAASERGTAARRFVTENASWQSALAVLPELLDPHRRATRDAA